MNAHYDNLGEEQRMGRIVDEENDVQSGAVSNSKRIEPVEVHREEGFMFQCCKRWTMRLISLMF